MPTITPGWVLQATRAYGPERRFRSGSVFAQGSSAVPAVNRSQVSRWESGASAITHPIARRYEQLCGTPEGQVVAAVELIRGDWTGGPALPLLRRTSSPDAVAEAGDLVERALEDEPLSGIDWDRLSWLLSSLPATFLRRRDWQSLTARGLVEMNVMTGLAYEQRSVSMVRLAGHPRAGTAVTEVVERVLTDPRAQIYSEAAALLQFVADDGGVARLLAGVASEPVNNNALRAALFVAATMIRSGRLTAEPAQTLIPLAYARCRDETEPYLVRRAAATLLVAVPPGVRRQLARRLAAERSEVDFTSILAEEGSLDPASQRLIIKRVEAHLAGVFGTSVYDDPMLSDVLRRLGRESNDEERGHIIQLLMLLPLGRHIGDAYVAELRSAMDDRDLRRAHEALSVLLCLTPGDNVQLVSEIATCVIEPALSRQLSVEASWALGNSKFTHPDVDPVVGPIAGAIEGALEGARPASPDLVRGWTYVLGMRGHTGLLRGLVPGHDEARRSGGADVIEAWTHARDWWLDLPAYVAPETCPDRHHFAPG